MAHWEPIGECGIKARLPPVLLLWPSRAVYLLYASHALLHNALKNHPLSVGIAQITMPDSTLPASVSDPIHILPTELFREVLSYVDWYTLLKTSTTSKAWRLYCIESFQWKRVLVQKCRLITLGAGTYTHPTTVAAQALRRSANRD